MRVRQKYLHSTFLFLLIVCVSCNPNKDSQHKEKKGIESILATARYCYNDYPPSYYFDGSDSIGVNFYFAGQLFNHTTDTFYMPNRELKFFKRYDDPHEETLYYALVNGDSLFFWSFAPSQRISPGNSIKLNLQHYITPENPKLLAIFKNIDKDQTILDTMKIYFATPDMQLEDERKLLPPIMLERSKKFRVDTVRRNSFYEQIFFSIDYYEDPPKELLKGWNGLPYY